jgi:hypothetical protein
MKAPLWELGLVAVLFITAKLSGDGFADTVTRYDSLMLGNGDQDLRQQIRRADPPRRLEDLVATWERNDWPKPLTPMPQPLPISTISTFVASVTDDLL